MYFNTPWGKPQHTEKLIPGVVHYATAGHGGLHLSASRIDSLPLCIKPENNWLRDMRWWEEDCDASIVRLVFAKEMFKAGVVNAASLQADVDNIKEYQPTLFEDLYVSLKLNDAFDIILA